MEVDCIGLCTGRFPLRQISPLKYSLFPQTRKTHQLHGGYCKKLSQQKCRYDLTACVGIQGFSSIANKMSHCVFSLYKHLVIARESEHGQALSSALGSSKGVDFFLLLMLTKVGLAGDGDPLSRGSFLNSPNK